MYFQIFWGKKLVKYGGWFVVKVQVFDYVMDYA